MVATEPTFQRPQLLHTFRSMRRREEEQARSNRFLLEALEVEKKSGLAIAVQARTAALGVIAILLPFLNPTWSVLYYECILLAFVLLGWAQLRVGRVGSSRVELALIFVDLLLLTFTAIGPNPWIGEDLPSAFVYRFDNFGYFFILLAAGTLAYSWRTIFAFGTWTAGLWLAGFAVIYWFGHTVPELSAFSASIASDSPTMSEFLDPNAPMFRLRVQEIVIFLLVAAILGLKGFRSNQLLIRQAEIAAERANLSRYFPPSLVDDLAARNEPLGEVGSQDVAVLFADIVGFTHIAEQMPPKQTVALLREFHAILADEIFNEHGTLDKFLGDGIMATFGTPATAPDDATRALRAARRIVAATDRWNLERGEVGEPAFPVSVGVHYGPVILGDIGTQNRLEFATLGDTVNVASRLESATRALGCRIVVSDALLEKAASVPDSARELTEGMRRHNALKLRGRETPIDVWTA